MTDALFEYALPMAVATKKPPPKKDDGKGKGKGEGKGKGKEGPVQTQMKGEKPGDDLGYDPSIIPTEDI